MGTEAIPFGMASRFSKHGFVTLKPEDAADHTQSERPVTGSNHSQHLGLALSLDCGNYGSRGRCLPQFSPSYELWVERHGRRVD